MNLKIEKKSAGEDYLELCGAAATAHGFFNSADMNMAVWAFCVLQRISSHLTEARELKCDKVRFSNLWHLIDFLSIQVAFMHAHSDSTCGQREGSLCRNAVQLPPQI